ncbi:hypothetical protein LSTR_LSTR001125 [Laodelphax striatellus]|uniref:Uncharacterized protein n=1 Tax=Laodelphax striatellus TaxID=195883 RepID=A0A482X188_LAOST|nr:hypothetical protein LSTR_LSTR001125 [Laodelphax striatellus]
MAATSFISAMRPRWRRWRPLIATFATSWLILRNVLNGRAKVVVVEWIANLDWRLTPSKLYSGIQAYCNKSYSSGWSFSTEHLGAFYVYIVMQLCRD